MNLPKKKNQKETLSSENEIKRLKAKGIHFYYDKKINPISKNTKEASRYASSHFRISVLLSIIAFTMLYVFFYMKQRQNNFIALGKDISIETTFFHPKDLETSIIKLSFSPNKESFLIEKNTAIKIVFKNASYQFDEKTFFIEKDLLVKKNNPLISKLIISRGNFFKSTHMIISSQKLEINKKITLK